MGAKNFFHDEICAMQEGEKLHIDDDYFFAKFQAEEAMQDQQIVEEFEQMQEDLDAAELPAWMHSRL